VGLGGPVAGAMARGGKVAVQQIAIDAFGNAIGDSLAAANSSGGDSWSGAARSPMVDPGTGAYSVFNNTMPSNNFAGVNAVMADAPDFGDQGPSRVDRSQDVRVAGDMTGGMSFGPYSGFGPSNAPGTDVLQVNPENGRLGYDQGDGAWVFPISSSSVEPMDVDQQQNNGDSIQAAPGLLRNLGSVAGAYLNGKVSLSAALSIANTQVGGIDNLGIDAIRALPNAAIGLVEFGLNVVGQGLMPGDLGATSLPRFDYTGKTGSWGPDIAMALPLLLGARRATTAEVATEIDRLAGLRKTHDGKVPAQIPDGRLAEADPFNTAVTGKAADLYSQARPYSGDPASLDFVGPPRPSFAGGAASEIGNTVNAVDLVQARPQELITEGHGVQRHGAQVTGAKLQGRAVEGLDPMTGTWVDGVHGGTHQYAQHATQVVSDEAYVFAENYGRSSQQFIDATTASTTGRAQLEIPLREIYGDDFRNFVSGVTRYGPKAAPTGSGNTIFSDDAYMIIRYKQSPSGTWNFNTMFPQPE
jgi:hypothetical protein